MKSLTEDQLRLLLNCAVCAGVEIARRIPNGAPQDRLDEEREEYVGKIVERV